MQLFSRYLLVCIHLCCSFVISAQLLDHSWNELSKSTQIDFLQSKEAMVIAENVLLYQRDIGGWPKNIQMQNTLSDEEKAELQQIKSSTKNVTIDNGATVQEMTFLANMYKLYRNEAYKNSFLKGLDYLLVAQYENGGWPQFYPLQNNYSQYISYNDDAMINVLRLLQKIIEQDAPYHDLNLSTSVLEQVELAFDRGIDCILKTQIRQKGVLTAWCAQHHPVTLLPEKARSYELESLSGKESAQIVLLLMSLENPSERVIQSINAAVKWFDQVKIEGFRENRIYNEEGKLIEKVILKDNSARPMWARFMDLETNEPFFCDRDGVKKSKLNEIGLERRVGYAWYTQEPLEIFSKYDAWLKKIKSLPQKKADLYEMLVSKSGNGDFTSIQDAIDHAKSFPYSRVVIRIQNGKYREKILVPAWNPMISLVGESKDSTIITYDDHFDKINKGRNSTFYTATLQVDGDDFYASNLTIRNSAGPVGQALSLSIHADRVKINNCNIFGHQDTFYASGEGNKVFIQNCSISGTTDFIFGEATVLFKNCEIKSLANSYITAASTPPGMDFGFVFKNCNLTAEEGVSKVYLGRPWRKYAKTVFLNCQLGPHIASEGWDNWNNQEAEALTFYGEYQSVGAGSSPKNRVAWSHQLKKKDFKKYKDGSILALSKFSKNDWYTYELDY